MHRGKHRIVADGLVVAVPDDVKSNASQTLLRCVACAADVRAELPYLRSLAKRLTLNTQDAHDLVQDAVVRALPALGKVTVGAHLRAWLSTILRRMHIDRVRKTAREPAAISLEEVRLDLFVPDDDAGDPPDTLRDDLEQALSALPEAFRRVLVLHELEGRSYREIATSLDIPLATVGTRLSRARLKLRMLLDARRAARA